MKYLARALKVACWLGLAGFSFFVISTYPVDTPVIEIGARLHFCCFIGAVLHGLNIWDCFDK